MLIRTTSRRSVPNVVAFFAPAVLALVLQHMGVTLTALSLVRERLSGAMDIFRVAPVRALEILIGKYLAYRVFQPVDRGADLLLAGRRAARADARARPATWRSW